jgi:hypothetical protein
MEGRGGVGRGGGVGVVEGYDRGKECFCLVKTQKKALAKTRRPLVSMVCLILLFGKGVPLSSLMMAGKAARRLHTDSEMEESVAANLEQGLPVAAEVWRAVERL